MTPERKAQLKALRARLANLSVAERETLAARGLIATVEGRTLSLHNTMLVYLQSNGTTPTVVGGYQQWQQAGKHVQKGEHGFTIWFPAKGKDTDNEDDIHFMLGTVFDISQTAPMQQGVVA